MKEVTYDPVVIKAHAFVLYRKAQRLAFLGALRGATIGLLVAFAAIASIGTFSEIHDRLEAADVRAKDVNWMFLIFPVIAAFRGWSKGDEKGWQLRLAAQQALCQVQIEENTRTRS